jgi:DNA polymerase III epsilon subunit-like protein
MNKFVQLSGHMLAAIDVETTGRDPCEHEIIQIGIQPLDCHIEPISGVPVFYHSIRPNYPEKAQEEASAVHKLSIDDIILNSPSQEKVADWLDNWFIKLKLPWKRKIVPVAHNWQFEAGFLKSWLGMESFDAFFHWSAQDTMLIANYIKMSAEFRGIRSPIRKVGLTSLCTQFGIVNESPHDALADARAEGRVLKKLLEMGL